MVDGTRNQYAIRRIEAEQLRHNNDLCEIARSVITFILCAAYSL